MRRSNELDAAEREVDCLVMIGHVAGGVAHDINNPLAGIQNSFLLVKDAIPETHPHHAYVAAIEREIKRMATITHGLVEIYPSHYERGARIMVGAIVGEAARLAATSLGLPTGRIGIDDQARLVFPGESCLLRHAVRLMLVAALKAASADEPVCATIGIEDGDLQLSIDYAGSLPSARLSSEPYPGRLVDVMGGTWHVGTARTGHVDIVLRLPLTAANVDVA
ncbi:MAG TPA: histidine kinase dimerization/phospho-acceptor domain-containing protein [Gemmatimonadales bacterium]|jgi:hypothetical protein